MYQITDTTMLDSELMPTCLYLLWESRTSYRKMAVCMFSYLHGYGLRGNMSHGEAQLVLLHAISDFLTFCTMPLNVSTCAGQAGLLAGERNGAALERPEEIFSNSHSAHKPYPSVGYRAGE